MMTKLFPLIYYNFYIGLDLNIYYNIITVIIYYKLTLRSSGEIREIPSGTFSPTIYLQDTSPLLYDYILLNRTLECDSHKLEFSVPVISPSI